MGGKIGEESCRRFLRRKNIFFIFGDDDGLGGDFLRGSFFDVLNEPGDDYFL